MKFFFQICAICVLLSSFLSSQELPQSFQDLQRIRNSKIRELNEQYVQALEKLKDQYVQKGELEVAKKLNEELKTARKTVAQAKLVVLPKTNEKQRKEIIGDWVFRSGAWRGTKKFLADGTWTSGNQHVGHWSIVQDVLIVAITGRKHRDIFPLTKDLKKLVGMNQAGNRVTGAKK